MAKIANYRTFNYGASTGFGQMYTFFINIHNWSYISCSTNQTLGKPGSWTKYATQTGNWYKKFSIKLTCFIFLCVLRKATEHVETKALSIRHQSQKGFHGILFGIPQHQKGCLIYVPITWKIVSSREIVLDETVSSELAYIPHQY